MAIQVTITDKRNPQDEYKRTFNQDRIILGRNNACDVCLPDLTVSTQHLDIRLQGTSYVAVDQGSMNGTQIQGKKLIPHRPHKLSNENVIDISCYRIAFSLGVVQGQAAPRNESTTQARSMLASILKGQDLNIPPALIVLSGPGKASRFELEPAPSTAIIGRSRQVDIHLDDPDISRHHAEVIFNDDKVTVKNKGSRNGIIFNSKKCEEVELVQGNTFVIGKTSLALEHPLDPCLNNIQRAPEEETSTYSPKELLNDKPEKIAIKDDQPKPTTTKEIPVGPSDPLEHRTGSDYIQTMEIPDTLKKDRSDIGFIVAGTIVVVLCIVGLILLLT